jgi:hypothetical protein
MSDTRRRKPTVDDETTVRALLAISGVMLPDDEVHALVAGYRTSRAALEAMHRVAEGAADGILVFRP